MKGFLVSSILLSLSISVQAATDEEVKMVNACATMAHVASVVIEDSVARQVLVADIKK